ncbi:MAG: hypothetical protein AAF391_10115 [Bacteroidota bacterium]
MDNVAGVIELAVTQIAPAQARQGSGILGIIEFEALAIGESTLELVNVELVDDAVDLVETSVVDSMIDVEPAVDIMHYLRFIER